MYKIRRTVKIVRLMWWGKRYDLCASVLLVFCFGIALSVLLLACGASYSAPCHDFVFRIWFGPVVFKARWSSFARVVSIVCRLMVLVTIAETFRLVYRTANKCLGLLALNDPIPADHGKTIAEFIRGVRYEPVEFEAVFTSDGEKLGEFTCLNTSSVSILRSCLRNNCIRIHNHPGNGDPVLSNLAFSSNDVAGAIRTNCRKIIVVAGNMIYTMELKHKHRPETATKIKKMLEEFKKDSFTYVPLCTPSSELTYDLYAMRLIDFWRQVAQKYDMIFTVEPFKTSRYLNEAKNDVAQTSADVLCSPDVAAGAKVLTSSDTMNHSQTDNTPSG